VDDELEGSDLAVLVGGDDACGGDEPVLLEEEQEALPPLGFLGEQGVPQSG